jgi:hypothetical protein
VADGFSRANTATPPCASLRISLQRWKRIRLVSEQLMARHSSAAPGLFRVRVNSQIARARQACYDLRAKQTGSFTDSMALPGTISFRGIRRQKCWMATLVAIALASWLIGFATHLDSADDATHSQGSIHTCTVCASLSAGVSSDIVLLSVPRARAVLVVTARMPGELRIRPRLHYLSRAPPFI